MKKHFLLAILISLFVFQTVSYGSETSGIYESVKSKQNEINSGIDKQIADIQVQINLLTQSNSASQTEKEKILQQLQQTISDMEKSKSEINSEFEKQLKKIEL